MIFTLCGLRWLMGKNMSFDAVGLLAQGGFVVTVLLGLSVVALTVILVKLGQFLALRLWSDAAPDQALQSIERGERGQALALEQRRVERSLTQSWLGTL